MNLIFNEPKFRKSNIFFKWSASMLILVLLSVFAISCSEDEKPKTIPEVTTGDPSDITTTSATMSGEITDDGNDEITENGFVYSNVVTVPTVSEEKAEGSDSDGEFTADLAGLTSGTKYYVRAYAINSKGTGYGEVVEVTTGNQAPTVTNVTITGEVEANKVVTVTYNYNDAEGNLEGATTFQWYAANDAAGTGEVAIAGATAETFLIQPAQEDKFLRVGVTPKAVIGTITGVEVKSTFAEVGEATTVTFPYNGASVTYGIIVSPTGKRWLDRNLGAANSPSASNDWANYGDFFQWGRAADGHQIVVRTGPDNANASSSSGTSTTQSSLDIAPDSKFILSGADGSAQNWRNPKNDNLWQGVNGVNNPCPTGWRLPTSQEWNDENLTDLATAYTKLRITLTGRRSGVSGNFLDITVTGNYWTSSVTSTNNVYSDELLVQASSATISQANRGAGFACRCIKD